MMFYRDFFRDFKFQYNLDWISILAKLRVC